MPIPKMVRSRLLRFRLAYNTLREMYTLLIASLSESPHIFVGDIIYHSAVRFVTGAPYDTHHFDLYFSLDAYLA